MAKEPHTRTLCAEPLEERLPVSSSAAGVLLGFGLASPEKEPGVSTPGYEAANEYNSTTPPFITRFEFDDTTLAATLDAMTVDRILGEDASDTTPGLASGALFSDADPFEMTPLSTTEGLSVDAATDPVRQIGDELLLIQISTLDFTQSQFGYMTPESTQHESTAASHNLDDALDVPTDATEYGFSPLVDDLEKDDGVIQQASCGSGCGSGCPTFPGQVLTASITGTGSALTYARCGDQRIYNFDDQTFYTLGNTSASIVASMNWSTPHAHDVIITNDASGSWQKTSHGDGVYSFTWTKPAGDAVATTQRDFTFVFYAQSSAGRDEVPMNVHIGYAEVQVKFAGQGSFHPCEVSGDKNDQAPDNTVVVGQKVEAKVVVDPVYTVVDDAYTWNTPNSNSVVKNYETGTSAGTITYLTQNDKSSSTVDYYYYLKPSGTGNVSCDLTVKDPHGKTTPAIPGASFYLETAVASPFPADHEDWPGQEMHEYWLENNAGNKVGLTPSSTPQKPIIGLIGFSWYFYVTTPIYGAGNFAYAQFINMDIEKDNSPKYMNTNENFALDLKYPYGNYNTHVGNSDSAKIFGHDAPNSDLFGNDGEDSMVSYVRSDHFKDYLIYRPDGADCIYVTLAYFEWGWRGKIIRNDSNSTWDEANVTIRQSNAARLDFQNRTLPTWDTNVNQYNNNWKERKKDP